MDLSQAIPSHVEWRYRLHDAILTGKRLDTEAISRDDLCEFGRWLRASQKRFGSNPVYAKCLCEHANFHIEAGKVAALINAGRGEEAKQRMAESSSYGEISRRICLAILELKSQGY